jgi:hypothetical protein
MNTWKAAQDRGQESIVRPIEISSRNASLNPSTPERIPISSPRMSRAFVHTPTTLRTRLRYTTTPTTPPIFTFAQLPPMSPTVREAAAKAKETDL